MASDGGGTVEAYAEEPNKSGAMTPLKASSESGSIEAIMASIRDRVRGGSQSAQAHSEIGVHLQPEWWERREEEARAEHEKGFIPLVHHPELEFANRHYAGWNSVPQFGSRLPIIGRLLVWLKRRFARFILNDVLADYFRKEVEYQAANVRFLNATARHIDRRDAEMFWSVMHKVDRDNFSMMERADALYREAVLTCQQLERDMQRGSRTEGGIAAGISFEAPEGGAFDQTGRPVGERWGN